LKRVWILILALVFSFGLVACSQSEPYSVATEVISTPTETPTETPVPPTTEPSITPPPSLLPSSTSTNTPFPTLSSPTATPCISKTGQLESSQINTSWLEKPLEYRVYTPPCYKHDPGQRYPVIYLLHGYGFNDDQWDRLEADEIADKLISSGETSPFIIVMPHDGEHNILPPTNQFGEALIFDLIPEIDAIYSTLPERQNRAIGGISRGGNWAIRLGLTHWSVFGIIGGHSAPLFITDGPPKIKDWLAGIPTESFPRVYLDIGESDKWIDKTIRIEEILDDFSVPHELYLFPGSHYEAYWSAHIEQYLRWYAQDW
jgi:enterochelin esterase-like enzyme